MPNLRGPELLIIVLLIVILFGAKRLPDAARSIGRSLRIFKAETKGLVDGEVAQDAAAAPEAPVAIDQAPGSGDRIGPAPQASQTQAAPPAPPPSQA